MNKNYHSTQEIFRRCFVNKTNTLRFSNTAYTLQDYLNAVYDEKTDSLRISSGGDSSTSQDSWVIEHKQALTYLVDHVAEIKALVDGGGSSGSGVIQPVIMSQQIIFDPSNAELEDVEDSDNDVETMYVFKVDGYVLFTGTYADNDSPYPDKYLAKTVFREKEGLNGTTYIYFEKESFEYFAELEPPKNILQLYVLKPQIVDSNSSSIHSDEITYLIDNIDAIKSLIEQGVVSSVSIVEKKITFDPSNAELEDVEDSDHDIETMYVFKVDGYVLFTGTYADNDAPAPDKYLAKTVFKKNEGKNGLSYIYFEQESFEYFAGLTPPKNTLQLYLLDTNSTDSNSYHTVSGENIIIPLQENSHYDIAGTFNALSFDVSSTFNAKHYVCEVVFTKPMGASINLPSGFKHTGSGTFADNTSYILTFKDKIIRIEQLN